MDVILLKDQRHLGTRGEVVKVKPGFARNYLLPQGIALEATPGNLKYFEQIKTKVDLEHAREREVAQAIADRLQGLRLEVAKRVGETETLYGSVTATEVAELLAAKGFEVDRRRIDLEPLDLAAEQTSDELLALDEALERLAAEEPACAEIVKLRYFAGLTIEEAAAARAISVRTANRDWAYAKAWLHQQLRGNAPADD